MLRIAYSIEFLIALIAIFTFWSQVGGQPHLDLMPWYLKFAIAIGVASVCVKWTSTMAGSERIWTGVTLRWLLILVAMAGLAGAVTYYYHLNEPAEPDDNDAVFTSSCSLPDSYSRANSVISTEPHVRITSRI
ncbi:MAG: hypothetical protein M3Z85_09440 [Acidobacteriota bacterium]|nr:hypothetical protein [Acidobacteriota bacterium]